MEVRNFIQTQLQPLMVCCSLQGTTHSMVLDNASILTCQEWSLGDHGPHVDHLMSIDIGLGIDLNEMTEDQTLGHPIVQIITKIPDSFYNSEATVELTMELIRIIRDQIITFFDNKNIMMTLGDSQFDPRHELSTNNWTFKIRHGISIVPYVTSDYNLGFRVNV